MLLLAVKIYYLTRPLLNGHFGCFQFSFYNNVATYIIEVSRYFIIQSWLHQFRDRSLPPKRNCHCFFPETDFFWFLSFAAQKLTYLKLTDFLKSIDILSIYILCIPKSSILVNLNFLKSSINASQSVVPGLAAWALTRNLLEIQVLGPHPRPTEIEAVGFKATNLFNRFSGYSDAG